MTSGVLAAVALAAALGSSCAAGQPWAFACTRSFMGHVSGDADSAPIPAGHSGDAEDAPWSAVPFEARNGAEAFAALTAMCCLLPLALDVVFLPVTLTHDLTMP